MGIAAAATLVVSLALAACGDDGKQADLLMDTAGDASTEAREDAAVMSTVDGGRDPLDFTPFALPDDEDPTGGGPAPAGWWCRPDLAGDAVCDCGCGGPDPACSPPGCSDPDCWASGCQACFDIHGQPTACNCEDAQGEAVDCPPPEAGYRCSGASREDGVCDCGCGEPDPDCAGSGCSEPGCEAAACQACHDAFGRDVPCPGAWTCKAAAFKDGELCHCGCGLADPDCGDDGCADGDCAADGCDVRHDDEGVAIRPDSWSCPAEDFAAEDGCDCGCGAVDPDCAGGCTEPGCRTDRCDRCYDEGGALRSCRWRCELSDLDSGGDCDCGCGDVDMDCRNLGCSEPGCYADACDVCYEGEGEGLSCDPGQCVGVQNDGVCDCGCRTQDPDCIGLADCVGPGCSEVDCGRCHAGDGSVIACADWSCGGLEQQGGGDGCNCGCGVVDADCAPGDGCREPGCIADGCVTCRSPNGSPMGCAP